MTIKLYKEPDKHIATIHAIGKLTKQDYHCFTHILERLIKEHRYSRIVFEMKAFHGWKSDAIWKDVKLNIRRFYHIERLAMVGNKLWKRKMCVFCQPFITAQVRYFDEDEGDKAHAWIHAESDMQPPKALPKQSL